MQKRATYWQQFQTFVAQNPDIFYFTWFCDVASLHPSRHCSRISERGLLRNLIPFTRGSSIRSSVTYHILYSIVFHTTVNMDVHIDIFHVNQLVCGGLTFGFFQNVWQKYHTSNWASVELKSLFRDRVIPERLWLFQSIDMTVGSAEVSKNKISHCWWPEYKNCKWNCYNPSCIRGHGASRRPSSYLQVKWKEFQHFLLTQSSPICVLAMFRFP